MKCMSEFVAFALGLFTEFNVLFQAEKPLFYRLKLVTESLIKELSMSFMKKDYVSTNAFQLNVNDRSVYLPLDSIYLGPNGQVSLLTLESDPDVPHDAVEFNDAELHNLFPLNLCTFSNMQKWLTLYQLSH